jgi:hypothetical protein
MHRQHFPPLEGFFPFPSGLLPAIPSCVQGNSSAIKRPTQSSVASQERSGRNVTVPSTRPARRSSHARILDARMLLCPVTRSNPESPRARAPRAGDGTCHLRPQQLLVLMLVEPLLVLGVLMEAFGLCPPFPYRESYRVPPGFLAQPASLPPASLRRAGDARACYEQHAPSARAGAWAGAQASNAGCRRAEKL